jgi:hypothetical protein
MHRLGLVLAFVVALSVNGQAPTKPGMISTYRSQPVFVPNLGQWDGDFLYKTRLGSMTVFVQRDGWRFTLEEVREKELAPDDPLRHDRKRNAWELSRGVAVGMNFVDASPPERVTPGKSSPGYHNYFLGNDASKWKSFVPLYEGVRIEKPWPGIDVATRIVDGRFEYDLLLDPERISTEPSSR